MQCPRSISNIFAGSQIIFGSSGVTDRDVIVAGLLHDIGKVGWQYQSATDRSGSEGPDEANLARYASAGCVGVSRWSLPGLALTMVHPEIGAEIARSLGCSERTCWLIRHHEAPTDLGDPDLARLQAADFAS